MKKQTGQNYLEKIPQHKEGLAWSQDEKGIVTLEVENKGLANRIAQKLLKKPKILILDDSTSAVDTKTDMLIQSAFREEIPDTTKIIIAQRISSVEKADKIIVLNDGKIDGFGTHEQLLENNEIYKEVYSSQKRVGGEE